MVGFDNYRATGSGCLKIIVVFSGMDFFSRQLVGIIIAGLADELHELGD